MIQEIIKNYDKLYQDGNFHRIWEGEISLRYKEPKYASFFADHFKGYKNLTILELGAGEGYLTKLIMEKVRYKRYLATEISEQGVKRLRDKGIEAMQMNAEELDFEDNSFDVVCCFDAMHHVADPRQMAKEMVRVAKNNIFLIEANGACLIRKLLEKTSRYKMVGEKSYTPKQYASFFSHPDVRKIYMKPFLAVFPLTPVVLAKPAILWSEIMEHLPLLKWQCSSVLISVEKHYEHNTR